MAEPPGTLRLDKFLWFARIVKTRALAQAMAAQGRLRLNGRVVDKAHATVRVGDVLGFARHGECACASTLVAIVFVAEPTCSWRRRRVLSAFHPNPSQRGATA